MKNTYIKPITTVTMCDTQALLAGSPDDPNKVRQNGGTTNTFIGGYSQGGDGTDMSKENSVWSSWDE